LNEAVRRSVIYQRELWQESEKESLAAVKEAGIEVHYPDKEAFMEKVKPLREKYKEDPMLKEIIESIEAMQ